MSCKLSKGIPRERKYLLIRRLTSLRESRRLSIPIPTSGGPPENNHQVSGVLDYDLEHTSPLRLEILPYIVEYFPFLFEDMVFARSASRYIRSLAVQRRL